MTRYKMSVSASVCAMMFAVPAIAQDTNLADGGEEGVIIVEARRRDENIQDVPLVVNAVTSEQLQKLNMRDFAEVQTLVPGLQLSSVANGLGGGAQLRGVQYDPNTGVRPSVEFYYNDAPIEGSLILQAMYDVGQVEVQRGPQGTLRGRASPSGSIVISSKKPNLNEAGGYVSATANSIGTQNYQGAIGLPIIPGIAAIRVAGVYDENEANRVKTIERDGDARDPHARTWSGRVSLLVEPTDWFRLEGTYQHLNRTSRSFDQYMAFSEANPDVAAPATVITARDRKSIQETPRNVDQTYNIYNWRAQVRGWGQVLIYQGQKFDLNVRSATNQDTANVFKGFDFYSRAHTGADVWTHEVRLQNEARVFDMLDYVVGYFRSNQTSTNDLISETPVLLPSSLGGGLATIAQTPISIASVPVKEESIFANLTAHIGSSTELSGGLRHIKYRDPGSEMTIGSKVLPGNPNIDSSTIYTASIKHRFGENLMVYASTGSSRRAGSFAVGDFSVQKSALQRSFEYLGPEKSKSYEIGIKSNWLDGRLQANLTGFHQNFKGYPYRSPTLIYYVNYNNVVSGGVETVTPVVGSFNFVSSVPVEVNGIEGEISLQATPNWSIGLTASYALGKIKNGLVACNDLNGDGLPDNVSAPPSLENLQAAVGANNVAACRISQRSSNLPPFSATLQSEYHAPISNKVDVFGRGLFVFNGQSQGDPQFAYDQVKGYGLLNLFAGLRDASGQWEVSFFAKNVLDTVKATSVGLPATTNYQQLNSSFQATGVTRTSAYSIISTTQPREFGVTVRHTFGSR